MLRVKTLSAHIFLVPGALYTYTMYVLFDLSEFLHYDSFLVRRIKIEDDQLICVLFCCDGQFLDFLELRQKLVMSSRIDFFMGQDIFHALGL